ncbi:unnamed protein product [Arabis nemorensis]|uniref:Uncharacterized protein n=1 Tax=Arabis nemorensis TaxID=586526 RepID=A0A565BVL5_9BRAS|nr:unnamed protein product [Arabis nemorensis]
MTSVAVTQDQNDTGLRNGSNLTKADLGQDEQPIKGFESEEKTKRQRFSSTSSSHDKGRNTEQRKKAMETARRTDGQICVYKVESDA